jgi:hypothetical protein
MDRIIAMKVMIANSFGGILEIQGALRMVRAKRTVTKARTIMTPIAVAKRRPRSHRLRWGVAAFGAGSFKVSLDTCFT